MTDDQIEAFRTEMREGFRSVNGRLDKVDARLAKVEAGVSDLRLGMYSIMAKLLAPSEASAIRDRMESDAQPANRR